MERGGTTYTIVPLEEEDAPALSGLEARCFSTAWDEARYRALLGAASAAWEMALRGGAYPSFFALGLREGGGALAGYITLGLLEAAGEVEIYNIAVAPERRGQGLGAWLLASSLGELARLGFARALLEVRETNAPALALYASAGFTPCGRRKKYYADTGEDALVLEVALPASGC